MNNWIWVTYLMVLLTHIFKAILSHLNLLVFFICLESTSLHVWRTGEKGLIVPGKRFPIAIVASLIVLSFNHIWLRFNKIICQLALFLLLRFFILLIELIWWLQRWILIDIFYLFGSFIVFSNWNENQFNPFTQSSTNYLKRKNFIWIVLKWFWSILFSVRVITSLG